MSNTNRTNFKYGASIDGMPVIPGLAGMPFSGTGWYVDYVNGNDGYDGRSPEAAFKTLFKAYTVAGVGKYNSGGTTLGTDGKGDVIFLLDNGLSTGSHRLSQTEKYSATVQFYWQKNNLHLIGCGNASRNNRTRISNLAADTAGLTEFFKINAYGCLFANFSVYEGYATANAGFLLWHDVGGRNTYSNVQFIGPTNSTSIAATDARALKLDGPTGENLFVACVIGQSTTPVAAGSKVMELAGGTPRNQFTGCTFEGNWAGAAGSAHVYAATGGVDRHTIFDNCLFLDNHFSGAVQLTSNFIMGAAGGGPNGNMLVRQCTTEATHWGDAVAKGYVLVDTAAAAGSGGVAAVST